MSAGNKNKNKHLIWSYSNFIGTYLFYYPRLIWNQTFSRGGPTSAKYCLFGTKIYKKIPFGTVPILNGIGYLEKWNSVWYTEI